MAQWRMDSDMADADAIISRLCRACGLCCNGVLFHRVELQPEDSAKDLSALGLKLKRKSGNPCLLQPCSAYLHDQCSIYQDRPTRCRSFECRLCEEIGGGKILESEAMEQIQIAKEQVARLEQLLEQLGRHRTNRPLGKRCASALAEPPGSSMSRTQWVTLEQGAADLDALLERRFRVRSDSSNPTD